MPGLCSNFTKCKSFLESNSPDILALYEAKLDDSIDLGILSATGYLPLIRKDSVTYMHGLAIYVKKGLLLHETYLQKTLQILTYVFVLLFCATSFSSVSHPLYLCIIFDTISSNIDEVVASVSIDFASNSKQDTPFHAITYDYSCADWVNLHYHQRDVPWEHIFKLRISAVATGFCEWIQVGIDAYIPHLNYQVKPHSP